MLTQVGPVVFQGTLGADSAGWLRHGPAKHSDFDPGVELLLNLFPEGGLIGSAVPIGVREVMEIAEALHDPGQRAVLQIPEDL